MYRVVYTIPIAGTDNGENLIATERSRVGNIFDTTRQKIILNTNTEAGESTIKVMTGIATFADLDDAANENLEIETNATTPIKINGKAALNDADWVDYSATSTIVGWSSYTVKKLAYKTVGKIQFWKYDLEGTSDSSDITFTIPNTSANTFENTSAIAYWTDNGTAFTSQAFTVLAANNTTVHAYLGSSGAWTGSGTKVIRGQFFIELP